MDYKIVKIGDAQQTSWLSLKPTSGILAYNQSATISISVIVSVEEAQRLHLDPTYLNTLIEVRTSDGQVFPIKINGTYIKSCFGAELTLLNSVYEGFAKVNPKLTDKELISGCPKKLVIPKEIFALTQWIAKYGIKTEKLFVLSGKEEDKQKIRECLALGISIPENVEAYSVADTLIDLLESLRGGVIPASDLTEAVKEYEESGDTNDKICENFLMKLPKERAVLVIYLLSFCKQLLEFADYNNLTVEKLVKLLCACLVKLDTTEWDMAYLQEENSERQVKISQIAIKRRLRFHGIFALLLC